MRSCETIIAEILEAYTMSLLHVAHTETEHVRRIP